MPISSITKTSTSYKVEKGDTFSEIVSQCIKVGMEGYVGLTIYPAGINKLKSFNKDIENENYIYVGQTITLRSSTSTAKTVSKAQRAKITAFGEQSNSNGVMYATWAWDKSNTEEYQVLWKYGTGDGVAWVATDSTTTYKYSTCQIPSNATRMMFQVRPVSKTYGQKNTKYWTAEWSTLVDKYLTDDYPRPLSSEAIDTETVEIKNQISLKITLLINSNEYNSAQTKPVSYLNAHEIQAQLLTSDGNLYKSLQNPISRVNSTGLGKVTFSFTLDYNKTYRIRYRTYKGKVTGTSYNKTSGEYSDWAYSTQEEFQTPLETAGRIITPITIRKNQSGEYIARINYEAVEGANEYKVQYTYDDPANFESEINIEEKETEVNWTDVVLTDIGKEYFFRATASNSKGDSGWSDIESVIIGSAPGSPTIWSSVNVSMVGDPFTLYWTHNTTDNSPESFAQLDLIVNNVPITIDDESGEYIERSGNNYITIIKPLDEYGLAITETSSFTITPSSDYFPAGAIVKWRIRTNGIYEESSPWSEYKEINVYAEPTVGLSVTTPIIINDVSEEIPIGLNSEVDENNNLTETPLLHFPINITTNSGPSQQMPVSYSLTVTSLSDYETVDNTGTVKMVKNGDVLLTAYYDTQERQLSKVLSANDLNLDNNCSYRIKVTVAMNSGLIGESYVDFLVSWEDQENWPDLEIGYDAQTFTSLLRPFCIDETEALVPDAMLSVYRREFDGTFTEIASDLESDNGTFIVDPHPSLDFARYRVVSKTASTGAINYYDPPGFEIGEKAVILQWDETWSRFKYSDESIQDDPAWAGELLRLPYNIDISDNHAPEVELIEYIGREHPVSYYGTQVGHTATWNVSIPKSDTETLYKLRELARWLGNVYVREPSGSGYLANVQVSFSQKHLELIIPVTLTITRVEGE